VQSRIKTEKANRRKGWIPGFEWQVAAFATLLIAFSIGVWHFFNQTDENPIANIEKLPDVAVPIPEKPSVSETIEETNVNSEISKSSSKHPMVSKKLFIKRTEKSVSFEKSKKTLALRNATESKEVKTDFIALSYAPAPESGQILKVKVPRSMMVLLGVTDNTENASELVKAEILMGNDGLARAIRFIQ
jgi:hypothetical protein